MAGMFAGFAGWCALYAPWERGKAFGEVFGGELLALIAAGIMLAWGIASYIKFAVGLREAASVFEALEDLMDDSLEPAKRTAKDKNHVTDIRIKK
jgi:hypothetical protein